MKTAAASAALPLVPGSALANLSGGSELYAQAANFVGQWGHSSTSMLRYYLGVDQETAVVLFDRMVENKIITKPDAQGWVKVLTPVYKNAALAAKLRGHQIGKVSAQSHIKSLQNSLSKVVGEPSVGDEIIQLDPEIDAQGSNEGIDADENAALSPESDLDVAPIKDDPTE